MDNKKDGSAWEKEFCEMAASHGFYAHQNNDGRAGQPYDVQLCRNNACIQIDCKVVHGESFSSNNIQDNQITAFRLLEHCGCHHNYFAIKFVAGDGKIDFRVLSYKNLGPKSFKREELGKLLCIF